MHSDTEILNIQPITMEESSIVLDLWKGSAIWLQNKGINQWDPDSFHIEDIIEYIDKGAEVLLARIDQDIVGTLIICWSDSEIWEELDTFEAAYIHKFAVHRKYEGTGIGPRILTWTEDYLKGKDKRVLRLDCISENTKLNQYYQKSGFEFIRKKIAWNINLYEKTIGE